MQGTVYRIVKPNGEWQFSDVALKKNKGDWTESQHPTEFSSKIVNETLEKKVEKKKVTTKQPNNKQRLETFENLKKALKFVFSVQCRGSIT